MSETVLVHHGRKSLGMILKESHLAKGITVQEILEREAEMNHEEQVARANFIKSILIVNFGLDDCHILWNNEQAKRHGGHLPGSHAIGFAMEWRGMTAVCPIAKSVAFDQRDGYFDVILELCGGVFNGRIALEMAEMVGI